MDEKKKNIVVLGAGFGGLRAALLLARGLRRHGLNQSHHVILVDRALHNTYTPLLYERAVVPEEAPAFAQIQYLSAFSIPFLVRDTGVTFVNTEVQDVHLKDRYVDAHKMRIPFEYLVLALGSEVNYFGIPGVEEHSFALKSCTDADALRVELYARYHARGKQLRVVVGGAGPTGVELASELRHWFPDVSITLVEGRSSVLPGYDSRVVRQVEARLKRLKIAVITGRPVARVHQRYLVLDGGERLHFGFFAWTAGVRPVSLSEGLPLKKNKRHRIIAGSLLRCASARPELRVRGRVFVVGDMGCVVHPDTGKPTPLVAQAALEQAEVVAHNVLSLVRGRRNRLRSFVPRKSYAYVVPVGGKYAVAKFGSFVVSGFAGWLLKGLVELHYLLLIMPMWRALFLWGRGFLVFLRRPRLG
jgi:NADH:ubiquinone reductase (H+-translocating)